MHPKHLAASISIHAAREGGDPVRPVQVFVHAAFQSTPPVKAATRCGLKKRGKADISIHAAREGGDEVISDKIAEANISIHAAREGGDRVIHLPIRVQNTFQSTPPVKAATRSGG